MSQIKRLQTIDADTLQSTAYEPVSFVVDDLLPQGLHLLAGAPKIGKSWLALWLCLCAAQGKPLWTFATRPCEVLYLCLEDSFQRIQSRLFDLTEDAPASQPASHLSGLRRSRCPAKRTGRAKPCTQISGRSPDPLLATIGEKHEKRYQIQHAHGVRRPREDQSSGGEGPHVHERLRHRLLSRQADRCHR